MKTKIITPEQMERQIARFKDVKPQSNSYSETGIPKEAYETMTAETLYLLMSPESQGGPMAAQPAASPLDDLPAWVKLFLTTGEKDKVTIRDIVGAILNSTGISRDSVGKVEIRDSFTLVEVRPADAERVASELNGSTLRDRRITARIDRKGRPTR